MLVKGGPGGHFTGKVQAITFDMSLQIINLRLQPHLPGANEFELHRLLPGVNGLLCLKTEVIDETLNMLCPFYDNVLVLFDTTTTLTSLIAPDIHQWRQGQGKFFVWGNFCWDDTFLCTMGDHEFLNEIDKKS